MAIEVSNKEKLRGAILSKTDRKEVKLPIDFGDGDMDVLFREPSFKESSAIFKYNKDGKFDEEHFSGDGAINSVLACCHDPETGTKLFEVADRPIVEQLDALTMNSLIMGCMKVLLPESKKN